MVYITIPAIPSCFMAFFSDPYSHFKNFQFFIHLVPEKQLKIKSGFFLNRVNISANQMIIGNSKGVNNRHVRFGSITSLGKGCNGHCTYMAFP